MKKLLFLVSLLFTLTSCDDDILVGDQFKVIEVTETDSYSKRYRIKVISENNKVNNTYIYTDSLYSVNDIIKLTK